MSRSALCAALLLAAPAAAREVAVDKGVSVRAEAPRGLRLVVRPRRGESWSELAERVAGDAAAAPRMPGREDRPRPDPSRRYEISLELIGEEMRARAVQALLPGDRCVDGGWLHRPSAGFAPDASYEALAAWFAADQTGAQRLEAALRRSTRGDGALLLACGPIAGWLARAHGCCQASAGAPGDMLLQPAPTPTTPAPAPVAALPVAEKTRPRAGRSPRATDEAPRDILASPPVVVATEPATPRSGGGGRSILEYRADGHGDYAVYRLRPGEAVYSAVILRFSDRVHARDVNELVKLVAERSGVKSFSDLPVGFEVKVPVEFLAPEFLPPQNPRRVEWQRRRDEIARFRNREVVESLDGVVVILDPGHGGSDRGAALNGVWESDYVYDITVRIKRKLEKTTRAKVFVVVRNRTVGYDPRDRKRLKPLTDSVVLTHPNYRLQDTVMGVNLRWYLANSLYRRQLKGGTEAGRVVFTSVHADSLHPSVRGAMVYVPGAQHVRGKHGRRDRGYKRFREVRENPIVSHNRGARRRAEGLSRQLAEHVLQSFRKRGLPIHEVKPIRGAVIRKRKEWVPAVLRANQVPTRILLEVCNLAHRDDARLLESPAFREQVAKAYVDALLAHYGGGGEKTVIARK